MAKVCFPVRVKYNGVNYEANTPFEVPESDVNTLCKQGGWQIKEPKIAETSVEEPKEQKPAKTRARKGKVKEV